MTSSGAAPSGVVFPLIVRILAGRGISMMAPLILSFDLDDTLWPVEPVMMAAERAMLSWLKQRHPEVMQGHSGESLRALRVRVAEQFPERSHDMTFLRHRAL